MQSCYNGLLLIRCGVVYFFLHWQSCQMWTKFISFFQACVPFGTFCCIIRSQSLSAAARSCYFSVTLKCQLGGCEVRLGVYILYGKFSLSGMLTIFRHEWMLDPITLFSVFVALIIHVFSSLIRWTASIDFQMLNLPSIPLGYNE